MTGPFDEDEFFDDEWVDVYDVAGHKASLRHLATIRCNEKNYMILGAVREGFEEKGALMLVREEQTVDGATEYVIANDEHEVEHVIGQFVMHILAEHMEELPPELSHEFTDLPEMDDACGCVHLPGEFCYCNDPDYLQ